MNKKNLNLSSIQINRWDDKMAVKMINQGPKKQKNTQRSHKLVKYIEPSLKNRSRLNPSPSKDKQNHSKKPHNIGTKNITTSNHFSHSKIKVKPANGVNGFRNKIMVLATSPAPASKSQSRSRSKPNSNILSLSKSKPKSLSKSISKSNGKSPLKYISKTKIQKVGKSKSKMSKSKSKSHSKSQSKLTTQRSRNSADKFKTFKNYHAKIDKDKQSQHLNSENIDQISRQKQVVRSLNSHENNLSEKRSQNVQARRTNELGDHKKQIKKKIGQRFQQIERNQVSMESEENVGKFKPKKMVAQIKTQFSERRGSFFDEELLLRLDMKKQDLKYQNFTNSNHAKSHFEIKNQNYQPMEVINHDPHSMSQFKMESTNFDSYSMRFKDAQFLKKEQELRWRFLLVELTNLKHEEKIPQKIDSIIKELNVNCLYLQNKSIELQIKSIESESKSIEVQKRDDKHFESLYFSEAHPIRQESEIEYEEENSSGNNGFDLPAPIQADTLESDTSTKHQLFQSNFHYPSTTANLSPNFNHTQNHFPIAQHSSKILIQTNAMSKGSQLIKDEDYQIAHNGDVKTEQRVDENEPSCQATVKNIFLDEQFFCHASTSKRALFSEDYTPNQLFSIQSINPPHNSFKPEDLPNISEKNLLDELNFIHPHQPKIEKLPNSSTKPNHLQDFQREMEDTVLFNQSKGLSTNHFIFQPSNGFFNEMELFGFHIDETDSESILLADEANQKERFVEEVEKELILEWCRSLMKNAKMLHLFLQTSKLAIVRNQNPGDKVLPLAVECNKLFSIDLVLKLLAFLSSQYQKNLMDELSKTYQVNPLDILRLMRDYECEFDVSSEKLNKSIERNHQEDQINQHDELRSSLQSGSIKPQFGMGIINLEIIERFQTAVLKNEFVFSEYHSFNGAIYDCLNEILEEMRPYGLAGKMYFSLKMSHSKPTMQHIQKESLAKFSRIIQQEDEISNWDEPIMEDINLEIKFFLSEYIMEEIFLDEVLLFQGLW